MRKTDKQLILYIWEGNIGERVLKRRNLNKNLPSNGKKNPNLYNFAGMKFYIFKPNEDEHIELRTFLYETDHFLKVIELVLDCKDKRIWVENFPKLMEWMEDPSPDTILRKIRRIVMNADKIYVEKKLSCKLEILERNVRSFYEMTIDDTLNLFRGNSLVVLAKRNWYLINPTSSNERKIMQQKLYENKVVEFNNEMERLNSEDTIFSNTFKIDWLRNKDKRVRLKSLEGNSGHFEYTEADLTKPFLEYIGQVIAFAVSENEREYANFNNEKLSRNDTVLCFTLREFEICVNMDFTVVVEYPIFFLLLRQMFDDYSLTFKNSLASSWTAHHNPGKSTSKLFRTSDDKLMVKTVYKHEFELFQRFSSVYLMNRLLNKDTLIIKYYGLYSYEMGNKRETFLVMNNLFPDYVNFREKYDFKGNLKFCSKRENLKVHSTYKEADFLNHHPNGLTLKKEHFDLIMKNLERDTMILQQFSIVDYSLLLGIQDSCEVFTSTLKKVRLSEGDRNLSDCLIPAKSLNGSLVYLRLGIVDILQWYNNNKVFEDNLKHAVYDENISVTNSACYRERLLRFVGSILRADSDSEFPKPIYLKSIGNNPFYRECEDEEDFDLVHDTWKYTPTP